MIYTITLNPALDKTIMQNNFKINEVNRINEVIESAGGKGINVSKIIKNLNGESVALGILGGRQGDFIKSQLDAVGIKNNFIYGEGNTRTNIKIVDLINHTYTDLNAEGMFVSEETLNRFEEYMFQTIKEGDILVMAGSVPPNIDKKIYKDWIIKAKEKNCKVLLDADDELLKYGVSAGSYLIKPNIYELERLFKLKIKTKEQAIDCGKELLGNGVNIVVISMGSEGCIVITNSKVISAAALDVEVKSTVGAGDAMVGAFAYAIERNMSIEDALCLGVASSAASIQFEGTTMGTLDTINNLKKRVIIVGS